MHFLLLAYYNSRYIKPLEYWANRLRNNGFIVKEMYPDKYYKDDVLDHLQMDYDVVIYFGHGIPGAWSGYNRISISDIKNINSKYSQKTIINLCCYSMSTTVELEKSFGEILFTQSIANCVLGYCDRVKYEDNLQFLNQFFEEYLTNEYNDFNDFLTSFWVANNLATQLPLILLH